MAELEKQLKTTHSNVDYPIHSSQQAIKATIASLEQLKAFFKKHSFTSKSEEIEFFKEIKPQLASKLIFYNEIYNIEISKLVG
ncbi:MULTISPECIES: RteC domain-containing protein [Flavobacterium]|nr:MULTISPECIES: RteC domain-containing protein [Flavobacterium]